MTKQIDSNIVAAAFDNVLEFNDIAMQFDQPKLASIDLQLNLIWEEFAMETLPAFEEGCNAVEYRLGMAEENKYATELLDGAVDTFVVVAGLLQKLQHHGMDVNAALLRVTENNLKKFTKKAEHVWADKNGYEVVWNEKYGCFSYRDDNGKLRKSPEYKSVELTDLIPNSFFKEQVCANQ